MATGIQLPTTTTTLSLERSPRLREKDTQSKRRYGTKTHFPSYHYFIAAINLALLFGAMKVKPPCSLAYLYC